MYLPRYFTCVPQGSRLDHLERRRRWNEELARRDAALRAERADHQRRGAQQAGQQREQRATRPHRRSGVRAAHFYAAKTLETSSTASFAPVLG